ncbi:MAG: exo-alpha-sialidase [Eubacteriales bacterium]
MEIDMKRKYLLLLFATVILLGNFSALASAAENEENYMSDLTFRNTQESNFRIPNLITTNDGRMFAFCNDRRNTVDDNADIQWLCYAVSEDGGNNFSDVRYLLKDEGWCYIIGAAVYDAVHDNIMLMYQAYIKTEAARTAYNALSEEQKAEKPLGNAIIESNDGGVTWKCRSFVMPKVLVEPKSYISTHGSSAGIQLKNGEYAGRLVIAGKAGSGNLNSVRRQDWDLVGCLIYSDDYGKTWKQCLNSMPHGTDETTVCELPDGTLYISSRMISNSYGRYVGYSKDGGRTLSDFRQDSTLEVQTGVGVRGGLLCIDDYDGKGNSLTLFSSLNSSTPFRRNLCIWISYDNGETWTDKTVIDPGLTSYGELCYNPTTGKISIMYEWGTVNCYSDGIKIDTFDTDWLLSHSVPNTSLRNVPPIGEGITAELVTDDLILQLNGDGISDFAATKVWYNSVSNVNTDISNGTAAVRENALNGESVMSFDGTSGLTVSGLDKLTGDITYFIVYKSNVASFVGSTDEPVIFRSTHANGLKTSVKPMYDSLCTQLTGGYFAVAEEFIDTDWHIVAVTWTGGDEQTALLSQFTDGNTTVKFEVGSLALKKSDAKGVQYIAQSFDGEIAEILVYNRCLDDSEVASTGMALAEKFGLTWTAYEPAEPGKDTENPDNTGSDTTESGTDTACESSADTAKNDKKGCGSSVGITAVGIVTSVCGTAVCKRRKRNK